MRHVLVTILAAAALWLLLLSAQSASASSGIAIIIMPPTLNTGEAPQLTTGYHGTPDALDWDDDDPLNQKVFIRTFGVAPYSSPTDIALAVGTDITDISPCKTTRVRFYEAGTWVIEGTIEWWHTLPRWENVNSVIHGDDTWAHLDSGHMSDTTSTFNCTSTGPHVHETFDSVDDLHDEFYPTGCSYCGTYENDDIAHWTMIVSW